MTEHLVFIPDVKDGKKDWAVKVTITEEMPTLIGYKRGTRYKRYILTDDQGNTILAIAYESVISAFSNILHVHGVYVISNASVKLPIGTSTSQINTLHWVLQRGTLVRPLIGEVPNLRYFLDGVSPISTIGRALDKPNETVDVMAIVISAEIAKFVTTDYGESPVQQFAVVDASRIPLTLSIWDQLVEHLGPKLTETSAVHTVIVAKRLRVKSYEGIALSANNGSSITFDPPIEAATTLKQWFESIKEVELPNMLKGYSVAFAKDLVDRNIIGKYSVGEIQSSTQCGDFWTRAFLQLSDGDQQLYYMGCSSCHTKVSARQAGYNYHCVHCRKDVVSSMRPRVSMDIYEHSGRITSGAINTVAEQILQTTALNIERLMKQGIGRELEPIKAEFENKMYLILVPRSYSKRSEAPRRLLLVAYFDDTVHDLPTQPICLNESVISSTGTTMVDSVTVTIPSSTKTGIDPPLSDVQRPPVDPAISPLKRQLDSVAITTGSPTKKALFNEGDRCSSSALAATKADP